MCRNRFWGIVGAAASAYSAYLAYAHLRDADFLWSHIGWSQLMYLVWTALALGLLSETRCWRERIFFGLVLLNMAIGLVFSVWDSPLNYAHEARDVSLITWSLAIIASLMTLAKPEASPQAVDHREKDADGLRN
jgi:hypothetical protein